MKPQDVWKSAHYEPPSWLPNWKHEDEYPEAKSASKQDYAWEFLRRNPHYQLDYKRISDLSFAEDIQGIYRKALGFNLFPSIMKSPSQPKLIKFHAELYRTLTKWGLSYYLLDPAYESYSLLRPGLKVYEYCPQEVDDPKVTDRTRYVSLDIDTLAPDHQRRYRLVTNIDAQDTIDLSSFGRIGMFNCSAHVVRFEGRLVPVDGGIIPEEGEVAYLFDWSLPIEPQVEKARLALMAKKEQAMGAEEGTLTDKQERIKDKPQNVRSKLLVRHLRILDADAREVPDGEIAKVIFPSKESQKYTAKSEYNPAVSALKDARDTPYSLLNGWYKLLLTT